MRNEMELINKGELKELTAPEVLIEKNKNENFQMNLVLEMTGKKIYKVFCIGDEHGKIRFSNVTNFPDGIFIEWIDSENVTFHIIEQKLSAYKHLEKITNQLFSGYFHTKILSAILNIPKENVNYKYYVSYVNDINMALKYAVKKPSISIPGKRALPASVLKQWDEAELIYSKGPYSKKINFTKIQLLENQQSGSRLNQFTMTFNI